MKVTKVAISYAWFVAVCVAGLFVRLGVMHLLIEFCNMGLGYRYVLASIIGIFAATMFNFIGTKFIAFSQKAQRGEECCLRDRLCFLQVLLVSLIGHHAALLLIAILILTIAYGLIAYHPTVPKESNNADTVLYTRILERIHDGETYYSVTGEELRKRGYASRSVFNWRLPVLAWSLGHLPSAKAGQVLAIILAFLTLLTWMTVFHQNQYTLKQFAAGGLLLTGPVIYSLLPGPFLMHEFWAGTLIALSLATYGRGWRYTSVICGLTALFLRELTLPFVCVMMGLAYIERRRGEALVWLLGILTFGGELFLHWSIVSKLITEKDLALKGGWVVFGGWTFVLETKNAPLTPDCSRMG